MKYCSTLTLTIVSLFFWLFGFTIKAQCDFDLNVQVLQNSTCISNGIIQVTLSGDEIDLSNVLIRVNNTEGTIDELSSTNGDIFLALRM